MRLLARAGIRLAARYYPWLALTLALYYAANYLKQQFDDMQEGLLGLPSNYQLAVACSKLASPDWRGAGSIQNGGGGTCGSVSQAAYNAGLGQYSMSNPTGFTVAALYDPIPNGNYVPRTYLRYTRTVSIAQQVTLNWFQGLQAAGTLGQMWADGMPWNPFPSLDPMGEPPLAPNRPTPEPIPWSVLPLRPNAETREGSSAGNTDPNAPPNGKPVSEPIYVQPGVVVPGDVPVIGNPNVNPGIDPSLVFPPNTGVVVNPSGQVSVQNQMHRNARPPRGTKERKIRVNMPIAIRLATKVAGFSTEALDFVDALYDALPDHAKPKRKRFKGADGKWHNAKVSNKDKTEAVYKHFGRVDLDQAMHNLIVNQIEDMAYGKLGRGLQKARNRIYEATGADPGNLHLSQMATKPVGMNGGLPGKEALDAAIPRKFGLEYLRRKTKEYI